jgi:hypothetical protein
LAASMKVGMFQWLVQFPNLSLFAMPSLTIGKVSI